MWRDADWDPSIKNTTIPGFGGGSLACETLITMVTTTRGEQHWQNYNHLTEYERIFTDATIKRKKGVDPGLLRGSPPSVEDVKHITLWSHVSSSDCLWLSVVDPGFTRRGASTPSVWDESRLFGKILVKNCIKMKEIGPRDAKDPPINVFFF